MRSRDAALIDSTSSGFYTRRLAVIFSFGYLGLFAISILVAYIPALNAAASNVVLGSGPALWLGNAFIRIADKGNCEWNLWDDRALHIISLALLVSIAWFEYFVLGFVIGGVVDTLVALKRRVLRLFSGR